MSRYNNIFDKKNIEFHLDGLNKTLPYSKVEDVTLKKNQIIFSSINNVLQKFLDNDLYNEALLQKYIDYGYLGGPTYVSSMSQIEDDPTLNKKFVVSGDGGLSVIRKEIEEISSTLSGPYLSSGVKVSQISFVDGKYVACTSNGLYESTDKRNWNLAIGSGHDVVAICFNYGFLNGSSALSSYDYLAAVDHSGSVRLIGHDGIANGLQRWSYVPESVAKIDGVAPTKIYSFEGDPKLYIGTIKNGLQSASLSGQKLVFTAESGTMPFTIYDMDDLQNGSEYDNYLIATNYGLKQSKKAFSFKGLQKKYWELGVHVFDAALHNGTYFIATSCGVYAKSQNEEASPSLIVGTDSLEVYSLVVSLNGRLYAGTSDGVYFIDSSEATKAGLSGKRVLELASFGSALFAYSLDENKIAFTRDGIAWSDVELNLAIDEGVRQLIANEDALYVVTNYGIYAIVDGGVLWFFSWRDSAIGSKNVYFAKNLQDSRVVLQVDGAVHVFDYSAGVGESLFVAEDQAFSKSNRVTNATKIPEEEIYFVVAGGFVYKIDASDGVVVSSVFVDGNKLEADKIAYLKNSLFDGLVYIESDGEKLRIVSRGADASIKIENKGGFSDIAIHENCIYARRGAGEIVRFYAGVVEGLVEDSRILDENGIALHEYLNSYGIVRKENDETSGFSLHTTDAYLSVFEDLVSIQAISSDILSAEIGLDEGDEAACADFIGYEANTDGADTLLIGSTNGLSAFNSETIDNGINLSYISNPALLNESVKPKAFADVFYRGSATGNISNAFNFVGSTNGLYALSAKHGFVKHSVPDGITSINSVAEVSLAKFLASNSGIYRIDGSKIALEAAVSGYMNSIAAHGDGLLISKREYPLLLSASANEETFDPKDLYSGDRNDFYIVEYSDDDEENGSETETIASLSSNYSETLRVSVDTISYDAFEESEDYPNPYFAQLLRSPAILSSSVLNAYSVSSMYKDNDGVKLQCIDGSVYRVDSVDSGQISVSKLQGEALCSVEDIIDQDETNVEEVSPRLSIGFDHDLDYEELKEDVAISGSRSIFEDAISVSNYVESERAASMTIDAAERRYHAPNVAGSSFVVSCMSSMMSVAIDFSQGVESAILTEEILVSGSVLSSVLKASLEEEYDDEGEPIIAEELSVIVNPVTGEEITIYQGQILSTFVTFEAEEAVPVENVLSVSLRIEEERDGWGSIRMYGSSLSSIFSDNSIAPGADFVFKSWFKIDGVEYKDGYSIDNAKMPFKYEVASNIAIDALTIKTLPRLFETIDGVYYDEAYAGKRSVCGYCVKYSDSAWLFFDGQSLYSFDGFIERKKEEDLGFVQISKTSVNDKFNDLYYFRCLDGSGDFGIRKTLITDKGKDFLVEKYSEDEGSISAIYAEEACLYALKDGKLWRTTATAFPSFEEALSVESALIADENKVKSCSGYTLALVETDDGPKYAYLQDGAAFYLNAFSELGEFQNFFVDNRNANVYAKTSDGILRFAIDGGELVAVKDIDFTEESFVAGAYIDSSFYHSQVVFGKEDYFVYGAAYDFKNGAYEALSGMEGESIVDLKPLSNQTTSPSLYVATSNKILRYKFSSFDSKAPSYIVDDISEQFQLNEVKSIYFKEGEEATDLYILDGTDLHIFYGYEDGEKLKDLSSYSKTYDFIESKYEQVSMDSFDGYEPIVVGKDFTGHIDEIPRMIEQRSFVYEHPIEISGFLDNPGDIDGVYVQSSTDAYRLSVSESADDRPVDYSLESVYSDPNGIGKIACIFSSKDGEDPSIWELGDGVVSLKRNDSDEDATYEIKNSPEEDAMFYAAGIPCIGAASSSNYGGVYTLNRIVGSVVDDSDAIHLDALEHYGSGVEYCRLAFLEGDAYIYSMLQTGENGSRVLFRSTNETIEEYLNSNYESSLPTVALAQMFYNYLFVSDGYSGYVYDIYDGAGSELDFVQLVDANGSDSALAFTKVNWPMGLIGYGSSFSTFEGFSFMRSYGEVNKKYVALQNNFRRGARIVEVLNDNPDFLIGTTFGLKYVYNDLMTRSFYSDDRKTAINGEVGAISKVLLGQSDDCFVVGQGDTLFEVTDLYDGTFSKLFSIKEAIPTNEDVKILDVFVVQQNEYLIATTNGLYLTSLRYKLIDDLSRFTIDSVYKIVNEELKRVISKHVAEDHDPPSKIINEVNKKASNSLALLSSADNHVDLYDQPFARSVKIVENDLIDTIVVGGDSLSSDTYVKVGISNWALKTMDTTATYTSDGFVDSFVDPTSGKKFDVSVVPYIVKTWKSGLKEIYVYVPTTGTYYANNPQGISNSKYSYEQYQRKNVPDASLYNTLPNGCTTLRVYLYNSFFKIKTIIAAQCTGNSLPLKIYKDNVNEDDSWKGVFDTVIQPSVLRTLPMTKTRDVNNVSYCTDSLDRICLDFSIYGTDAQAIRIIAQT